MNEDSTNVQISQISAKKTPLQAILSPSTPFGSVSTDKVTGKTFKFLRRTLNKDYEKGIKTKRVSKQKRELVKVKIDKIKLRNERKNLLRSDSCLLHDNSDRNNIKIPRILNDIVNGTIRIKTEPKWITDLLMTTYDFETGEQLGVSIYSTNEQKSVIGRKLSKLRAFFNEYEPRKAKGEVQIYFLTFTRATYSRLMFYEQMDNIQKRFRDNGKPILGYIWTSEVGEDSKFYGESKKTEGLQWHYHLVIAIEQKQRFKNIPSWAKLEQVWGQRTQIEPVIHSGLEMYLAKYLAKCRYSVLGVRTMGKSRVYK